MTVKFAVVGGGISGLSAAYRIRKTAGEEAGILLFDPAAELGGALRTVIVGGEAMDVGAEAFVARRPEVPALLAELGMADRQIGTTGVRPLIYAAGRLHPMPAGTVNGIPTSAQSLIGLVDDETLARVRAEPGRAMPWTSGTDPSVAEVVGDRFGTQVLARSVDPMLSGVYAGSAATIGMRSAVPGVAAALDRGAASLTEAARAALPPTTGVPIFGAIRGGYRQLVDELARRSRAERVNAAVSGLRRTDAGWELRGSGDSAWHADAVVIAVPAVALPPLLDSIAPAAAAAARRIPVASSAVVALAVPAGSTLPNQSGVLVAGGEALRTKAVTLSSRKWGQSGDVELLRCSFGRYGDDVAATTSDEQLTQWALDDISTLFGLVINPVEVRVQRWIDAMPQYVPGHSGLAAEIRAGLPGSIAVAGNYLDGIGVPACIASGAAAAEQVAETAVAR